MAVFKFHLKEKCYYVLGVSRIRSSLWARWKPKPQTFRNPRRWSASQSQSLVPTTLLRSAQRWATSPLTITSNSIFLFCLSSTSSYCEADEGPEAGTVLSPPSLPSLRKSMKGLQNDIGSELWCLQQWPNKVHVCETFRVRTLMAIVCEMLTALYRVNLTFRHLSPSMAAQIQEIAAVLQQRSTFPIGIPIRMTT